MPAILSLIRDTFTNNETFGKMYIDGEFICHTIERPWKGNIQGESCIPEGKYKLQLRFSPMVKKSSGGKYDEGYEITNVTGRTYIMLHPANFASELRGCCATGESRGVINGIPAVLNSRKAFDKLMNKLEERNEWEILITNLK